MSFDVNVLSVKPVIREAASMNNDGGAGNLGYMQQGQKEEKEKQNRLDESIFRKKEEDIFISKKDLEGFDEGSSLIKWVENLIESIKKIFRK